MPESSFLLFSVALGAQLLVQEWNLGESGVECCGCKEKTAVWMPSITYPHVTHYMPKSTFAVHQALTESINGPI